MKFTCINIWIPTTTATTKWYQAQLPFFVVQIPLYLVQFPLLHFHQYSIPWIPVFVDMESIFVSFAHIDHHLLWKIMNTFLKIGFSGMVLHGQGCGSQIGKHIKDKLVLSLWAFSHFETFHIQSSLFDPFYQCRLHWKSKITKLLRSSYSWVLESLGNSKKSLFFQLNTYS